jgi:hypothetical protein
VGREAEGPRWILAASLWDISAGRMHLLPRNMLRREPGGDLNKATQILKFLFQQRVIIFKVEDLFS